MSGLLELDKYMINSKYHKSNDLIKELMKIHHKKPDFMRVFRESLKINKSLKEFEIEYVTKIRRYDVKR